MIDRTKRGWVVLSEGGKRLSKSNLSHAQAEKRLHQVEWFKHHPKSKG